jgi:Uma2 family endonuclease
MASILDSPEVREALAPMSVEFYQAAADLGWWDEDVELLEGFPVKKRSKSPLHENLIEELIEELIERLRAILGGDRWVSKERPIQCTNSQPEPDIAVFAGPRGFRASSHPTTAELVIEVAVNTLDKDRRKAPIYGAAGVKEYWIVDPASGDILVHRKAGAAGYAKVASSGPGEVVACESVPGFSIAVSELLGAA